ncbi:MAG: DUF393 domain-containing protein [Lentisphaerales bacterium]|nr:DUF393 domain-containing protein [Lentisphaerales bacterium]
MLIPGIDLTKHSILLYDGDCLFCSHSVHFILKRDKPGHFKFASLKSDIGQQLIKEHTSGELPDSLILFNQEGIHFKSRAALRVCTKLSGLWKLFSIFLIIPAFILDPIYDFIARHRQKIIKNSCALPSKEFNDRFLS